MHDTDYYFEDCGFILSNTGQPWKGKGDTLFRTAQFALFHANPTLLMNCRDLLKERRRWPVVLDDPTGKEHRNPKRMTRDPYWMFYMACNEMRRLDLAWSVRYPWYIWRPAFGAFVNAVKTDRKWPKRWFRFWSKVDDFLFGRWLPAFALYLNCWAAWTLDDEKTMAILRKRVPNWNLLLRQLTKHPDRHWDSSEIRDYEPRTGSQWQKDSYPTGKVLPKGQKYYLDLDALKYVKKNNEQKTA